MSTLTNATGQEVSAPQETSKTHMAAANSLRVLVAVDGSNGGSSRAIQYLLRLHELGVALEVVLLNVQPVPQTWRLRGYSWFKREEIRDRLINELGRSSLMSASQQLDHAGIAHKDRVDLGEAAETILRCARDEECDLVVLTDAYPGTVRQWLLRSIAVSVSSVSSVVIGFAHVPVMVVK